MSTNPSPEPKPLAELLHYYEIRMAAFSSYAELAWNRFNWLLTLQVAISGFYVTQAPAPSEGARLLGGIPITWAVPALALAVAAVWATVGWADFRSLRRFHEKSKAVENSVRDQFLLTGHPVPTAKAASRPIRQTWLLFALPLFWALVWAGALPWNCVLP